MLSGKAIEGNKLSIGVIKYMITLIIHSFNSIQIIFFCWKWTTLLFIKINFFLDKSFTAEGSCSTLIPNKEYADSKFVTLKVLDVS